MYIDNLTLAGIAVSALYLLLPVLFGHETLRVAPDAPHPEAAKPVAPPRERPCLES